MKRILIIVLIGILMYESVKARHSTELIDSQKTAPSSYTLIDVSNNKWSTKQLDSWHHSKIHKSLKLSFDSKTRHEKYVSSQDSIDQYIKNLDLQPLSAVLEDVVVTGQHQPQSIRNSVYQVKTIAKQEMMAHGSSSLIEALANELNIQFSRDNATGSSGIELQGLSGQYVKILLDGMPITGRSGVGNEIDLGQIDIQNVDRVEIIEGPMAVNYGADALAGVINIISKQGTLDKLSLNIDLQEESVGKEYDLKTAGIHSKSLSIGYRINDNLFGQLTGRQHRFGGWNGSSDSRQNEWYPKNQFFGSSSLNFSLDKFSLNYRLDLMKESLENLGAINANNPFKDPFALDEEYLTKRWSHQFQSELEIRKATLNSAISSSSYTRITREFRLNMITNQKEITFNEQQDTISYHSIHIRETLNNFIKKDWISVQAGIEFQRETADGSTLTDGLKTSYNSGIFSSAEFILGRFKIRPGIRVSLHNIFPTATTPSINFKYNINDKYHLRWSYGRGFRVPSVRELYHEFIDSNHYIQGNSNLLPETSNSWNINFSGQQSNNSFHWEIGLFHTRISNQITYLTPELANQATSYINLLNYKTTGANITGSFRTKWLEVKSGISYIGRYQRLSEQQEIPTFLFSPKANAQLSAHHKNKKLPKYSLFYTYTGPLKTYQIDETNQPRLNETDGYHLVDLNITEKLIDGLSLSIGIKNILDVTTINSDSSSGAHTYTNGQRSVSYGRSYFLKINYQISK